METVVIRIIFLLEKMRLVRVGLSAMMTTMDFVA